MDIVRELIIDQLQKQRLSMSQASLKIGRNASYLQQFLRRGVPEELHEKERIKLAELLGVEENQLRGKSAPLLSRAYTRNSNAAQSHGPSDVSTGGVEQKLLDTLRPLPISNYIQDLPVFTTILSGGAMVMTKHSVDRIVRPNFLQHVVDAYGLIIIDDAMDPEVKNGATIVVHPHRPARSGDACVFCSDGTDVVVTVRQLVSVTDRTWKVRQHNPRKTYDLKKSDWPVCHTVVAIYPR